MRTREPLVCVALAVFLAGCESVDSPMRSNPFDPDGLAYKPPAALIVGMPDNNFLVETPPITFRWRGNTESATTFSYRLSGSAPNGAGTTEGEWSRWGPARSVTYDVLDEGGHVFEVRAQYPTGQESVGAESRRFSVDAVKGPALMTRPRQVLARIGDTVRLDVLAEEVSEVMLAHVVISYDSGALELMQVERGDMMRQHAEDHGGTPIFLSDATRGTIDVSVGVATADPAGASGTDSLLALEFRVRRVGRSAVDFATTSELRDGANKALPDLTLAPGYVVVSTRN